MAGGYYYFHGTRTNLIKTKTNELQSIAELKKGQLILWREERMADVTILSKGGLIQRAFMDIAVNPGNSANRTALTERLNLTTAEYGYKSILLLDKNSKLILASGEDTVLSDRQIRESILRSRAESGIVFTDFYFSGSDNTIKYDIVSPMIKKSGEILGFVLVRIDPYEYIYPSLRRWPIQSTTSETYLAKKEGDSVLILSQLRHKAIRPLTTLFSMKDSLTAVVQALQGYNGIIEAVDYRNHEVIAYVTSIPGTSWVLISKIDADELFEGLRARTFLIIIISLLLLALVNIFLSYIYNIKQKKLFKKLYSAEEEFRITLQSIDDGVITTDMLGRIRYINPVAENLTGWTETEAKNLEIDRVLHLINEDERTPIENPVNMVIQSGKSVRLSNHTILVSRNGEETPIADSGAPIKDQDGNITGVVLILRNQKYEREVKRALKQSAERYSFALELVNEAVYQWTLSTGVWSTSLLFYKILDIDSTIELNYEKIVELVADEDKARVIREIKTALVQEGIYSIQFRVRRNDESTAWMELRGKVAEYNAEGKPEKIGGTLTDITQKKNDERNISLLNERYERAEEYTLLGSWSYNIKDGTGIWSKQMFRLFGIEERSAAPSFEEYLEYIAEEDRERVAKDIEAIRKGGQPNTSVYRTNNKKCKFRYLLPSIRIIRDAAGNVQGYEGTVQDITATRSAEENYRRLFEAMLDGFALHQMIYDEKGNPVDYIFITVNHAFETITGLESSDIIGKRVTEVLPDIEESWIVNYGKVAKTGVPAVFENFSLNLRKHFEVSTFQPMPDYFACIFTDVTERKNTEKIRRMQYVIANAVINAEDFGELFEIVSLELQNFIDIRNIFIALYNPETNMLSAPFEKDEVDNIPVWSAEKSLTGYLIKQNKSMLLSKQDIQRLTGEGVIELVGTISEQWAGFPLAVKNNVFGAFVLQSYDKQDVISEAQFQILEGVASQLSIYIGQKRAEEELRENEQRFRQLFEDHTAVELLIDAETAKIADVNHAATRFYGWSREQLKTKYVYEINTLPKSEIFRVMDMIQKEEKNRFEFQHRLESGELRDVEVFSSKVEIGGKWFINSIIHDITDKKKADNQLKLLSKSIEQSPVSVIITDPLGKIEYVNTTYLRISGYTEEEIYGETPRIQSSGHHNKEFYETMWNTILSGKTWHGEILNKRKNGETFWEDVIISPIVNESGDITNFVAVKEDITEKKKIIQELILAKEKAEEMNQVKNNFFANMSHELRTPLIGILGFSEILEMELDGNEELQSMANTINKGGNRLLETLNLILNISKLEAGKQELHLKSTDIVKQIYDIQQFFGSAASIKNLDFNSVLPGESINCMIDPNLFNSVINNLINNAIKFTNKGFVTITVTKDEDYGIIIIQDTGIGIPEEKYHIVWEEFRQGSEGLSRTYEGTGLGLSIAKRYTEMMKGHISFVSVRDEGTTFTLKYPLT